MEIIHPDKGTELLLYELSVDEPCRRRGIGRQLVRSLADLARERRRRGVWVPIEDADDRALETYLSAGVDSTERAVIAAWDLST